MSDRKYRQSGYQDVDRPAERKGPKQGPRPRKEGPRGRGLGKPTANVVRCAACGEKVEAGAEIALDLVCGKCGADLHTCTGCRHFEPSLAMECREPIKERVAKKSKRNGCELFASKVTQEFAAEQPSPDDARSAFDSLFDF